MVFRRCHSVRQLPSNPGEAEERFRLLVESVRDYAIFILDPEGYVSTWNAGAERINGYAAREIIGKHFSSFYPPEVIATGKCDAELEIAAREGRFEEEGWRLRKDGSPIWANVTITALRDPSGTLVGFAKVTRDLTTRKEAEESLTRCSPKNARRGLKRSAFRSFRNASWQFSGTTSVTPWHQSTWAQGFSRQSVTDPANIRILDRMQSSSRRMTRMIEQILDLTRSRLAGGLEMVLEPTDLRLALTRIVEELRVAFPGRSIVLDCPPFGGLWDRDRLEQVFSNLIGNALVHGDPDRPRHGPGEYGCQSGRNFGAQPGCADPARSRGDALQPVPAWRTREQYAVSRPHKHNVLLNIFELRLRKWCP